MPRKKKPKIIPSALIRGTQVPRPATHQAFCHEPRSTPKNISRQSSIFLHKNATYERVTKGINVIVLEAVRKHIK